MKSRFSKNLGRGLSALLIGITGLTGINGCATTKEYRAKDNKIRDIIAYNANSSETMSRMKDFIPKNETLRDISLRHRDYNGDGKLDFYDALLTSTGNDKKENLVRMIEVLYKYTSEGKIMQNPIIVYQITNWQKMQDGKLIAITEKSQKHDCGTKKLSSEDELPESITSYQPDGNFDYEDTTHIELPFSIQIIPNQDSKDAPKNIPEKNELEKKLDEINQRSKGPKITI
ncbi:hypothetical protein J4466_04690 [Candidatus Pacearchaeota archaeon]|nr:hypothetical protein [Candidatus Pacearchaeota archaeon]